MIKLTDVAVTSALTHYPSMKTIPTGVRYWCELDCLYDFFSTLAWQNLAIAHPKYIKDKLLHFRPGSQNLYS